jgi:DNA-binding NtrC family response regulator
MSRHRLLFIGQEASTLFGENDSLYSREFHFIEAFDEKEALSILSEDVVDGVVVSESIEDGRGLEIARDIHFSYGHLTIMLLTSELFEESETLGNIEALPASLDPEIILQFLKLDLEKNQLSRQNAILTKNPLSRKTSDGKSLPVKTPPLYLEDELVGVSAAIRKVRQDIVEVASTDMSVLIRGETGTGKDVIARLLHQVGTESKGGSFVKICCPALPEQLLESELFGHEAGAFTGALKKKPGRMEIAKNGTTFLDEITEMPPSVQAKLLEVLEHKTFMRVGGNEQITIDTTFVAATNVSQDKIFDEKGFREDLFYRLNQYSIELPPLRERPEDIPHLVEHFLEKYGIIYNNVGLHVSDRTMSIMTQYQWPGNVRELESVARRYALTAKEDIILDELLPYLEAAAPAAESIPVVDQGILHVPIVVAPETTETPSKKCGTYKENEKRVIEEALAETHWNRRKAAEILGVSYNTLRRRIAEYELV